MKVNFEFSLETESCEFKKSLSELDKGVESLAAMLNKHSKGDVFYGVENNGDIIGLNEQIGEETIKKVGNRINELIKPTIIPTIIIEEYENKKIIHISAKGNRKPYSSSGDYRIRIGSENKKIDPELLKELFFDSDSSSLESIECINQNLTFNTLKYFYNINGLTINEDKFYENANLKVNGKFNMLAELLADENNASIKVVRFAGVDKTKMISRNEYGFKCLLVAMKEASSYVNALNETRVDIESSLERIETKLFDSHAFEEAWTNACVHNKWIKNVPPAIYIFSNRIEIISTGGLPFDFSKEDFYGGLSKPINNGLFTIMGKLNIIEQTGHGNLVIIEKYGKEAFDIEENHITVTIPFAFTPSMNQLNIDGLTTTHNKVLLALKTNPLFSIDDISKFCGIGTTRVSEILRSLKELGKIERIGGNKNGYWKVN